ncbi:hypothetical protein [Streptomyces sp. WAC05374]|uniref:hypothetical protein n=1 Tax=Streptomyces sp. WAC05374 TaxID=2487420 RepID=UPI001F240753|nr:hypothetical protein [Streptomyces sp. WAC05374]
MTRPITVQWVHTVWTKDSRGGEAAARRHALPVGFPLPGDADGPFCHYVRMDEWRDFAPEAVIRPLGDAPVRLLERDGKLSVLPRVNPLYGLPPRKRRPPAVRLAPGEWLRWQLNYRFSSALGIRGWTYWLDTFNVAYGPVRPGVFLGEPSRLMDETGPVR